MMKRNLHLLTNHQFDLLIIGGGIYGACVAWDAAQRGLSVALIEQNDFGSATSANSLKFIHGGLRYLQDGRLPLVRRMTLERKNWLRIAPHLVRPMPILVPTLPKLTRSRLALGAALRFNNWIGLDRNRGLPPAQWLGDGRLLNRAQYQEQAGWIDPQATGAALWYDAQMLNSERLLLSFILAAANRGAVVANYVQATDFVGDRELAGITAVDTLINQPLEIRARLIVNCAGAWTDELLALLNDRLGRRRIPHPPSLALNLITHRLPPQATIGVISPSGQMLFIAPWRDVTLIGTWHKAIAHHAADSHLTEDLIQTCLNDINAAYPPANLSRADIRHIHTGFLPAYDKAEPVRLLREGVIYDHGRDGSDGLPNLITVLGVKYTTARWLAQQAVDLALKKLGHASIPCHTAHTPLPGGEMPDFVSFLEEVMTTRPSTIPDQTMHHLVSTYGALYPQLLSLVAENPAWGEPVTTNSPVIKAEVIHAIRHDMAQTLSDVVMRRTELGAAGLPEIGAIQTCAALAAAELGWDKTRCHQEIEEMLHQSPISNLLISNLPSALTTGKP
ncbi:MAG TPA: glycerol-3-phosphate dehydrogenase/oxidase [Chloroflexota bacterium]|nr:glycerol-3-phosphate dehydrogenase/oxidase [Chloroflexota bacterium]